MALWFSRAPAEPPAWRSVTLRPWCIFLLLFTEVAIIITITALLVLSNKWTGFIGVSFQEASTNINSLGGALEWGQGLLWTTLPTLLIVLYKMLRDAILGALIMEIPFMELYKTRAGTTVEARKSVYLDYRSSFTLVAWWRAFRNGHIFLAICIFLSFLGSIILIPFTARLFATRVEQLPVDAPINLVSVFDASAELVDANYGALMDGVSAAWIHESPLPAGTDGLHAFSRITPTEAYENYTIVLPTNASRLTLDCGSVTISSATIVITQQTDEIFLIEYSATDRGCAIAGDVSTSPDGNDFLGAVLTDNCGETAGLSRITFFYGSFSGTAGGLSNPIIISCIPNYWMVSGDLSVAATATMANRSIEAPLFNPQTSSTLDIGFTRNQFESGLMMVQTFNPSTSSAGNTNAPLRLAELVVRRIEALNASYTASTLIAAAQRIYPALFTILALTYFYPTLATPLQQQGTLSVPQNRLHVVAPVAIIVLVLLAILLLSTLYLLYYLHRHPSILAEEPIGLLGAANLLHASNIPAIIDAFHSQDDFDGRLSRVLQRKPQMRRLDDALKETECWVEQGPRDHDVIIKMRTNGDGSYDHGHGHDGGAGVSGGGGVVISRTAGENTTLINELALKTPGAPELDFGANTPGFGRSQVVVEHEISDVPPVMPNVAGRFYSVRGYQPVQNGESNNALFNRATVRRKPVAGSGV